MAFSAETIYVTLEGGVVLPITGVTDEKSASDVTGYDGETYRNELDANYIGREWDSLIARPYASPGAPESADDRFTATAPAFKAKKRTIWSFPRSGKFTHLVWADLVQGTSPVAPYRLGQTPTSVA